MLIYCIKLDHVLYSINYDRHNICLSMHGNCKCMKSEYVYTADSTSFASDSKLLSSKSSMSFRQEHGFTPFPFNQCWNMERQHSSGSVGWVFSISSSLVPLPSKSISAPNFCHFGATVSITLIFFPLPIRNIVSVLRVGVVSVKNKSYMTLFQTKKGACTLLILTKS